MFALLLFTVVSSVVVSLDCLVLVLPMTTLLVEL